jgi:hypothetical protein
MQDRADESFRPRGFLMIFVGVGALDDPFGVAISFLKSGTINTFQKNVYIL